ncbi:BMC domain-containing protein [Bacillus sp. 31A1R]|uniref:BMC domain-containing protein n=1 Tax=Robertmurraya mangrovi TaxID=3098077 RepID=A0ABU5J3Z5_9BACI|nr:BMC domain-containing protein [Bacillus sp. 31A1R]MDZ5474061.1 BMC domain-containing protein [Bacillus sp. 31A1R]
MKQYEAIGVIEAQYYTIAIELLDVMCKSSNVEFITSENYLGGRLVSLLVGGSISDVAAAVETVKQVCQQKETNPLKMAIVISKPHPEILRYIIPSSVKEEEVTTKPKTRRNTRRKNNE